MIEEKKRKALAWTRRWWQAAFVLLLIGSVALELIPKAKAQSAVTEETTTVAGVPERVAASRILLMDSENKETDAVLKGGKKVTIRRGEDVQYATSRDHERVSELLQREGIEVNLPELVRVELLEDEIIIEIAASFTYYETVAEPSTYNTVYTTDYSIPKGETRVTQPGEDGTRDVTYEVVYADGEFVSRQAVAEGNDTSVTEIVSTGTLVREAKQGDTIASVIRKDDGSGYLILKSGDSLHFTRTMEVKCTAYTCGYDGVGSTTYTGTKVHTGVVAVDKSVIPLGSRMFITTKNGDFTYGMAHAEDTGVRGLVVDLFMNTYNECIQFGRRSSILYFLDE